MGWGLSALGSNTNWEGLTYPKIAQTAIKFQKFDDTYVIFYFLPMRNFDIV